MTTPHQVQTEATNLAVAEEDVLGNATPVATGWHNVEPNSYGAFGSKFKKTPRDPITKSQQLQKGMLVDEDSGIEIEIDVTKEHIDRFAQGVFRSKTKHSGGTGKSLWYPTAVTGSTQAFLDLATKTTHCTTIVEAKLGGVDGNGITIAFTAGSLLDGGALDESAYPAIAFNYKTGVTKVSDFESAVRLSTYLAIKTAGVGASVLADPADTFLAAALAGGLSGSFTVDTTGAAAIPVGRLVFARVFAKSQNRGLFVVVAGGDAQHVEVDHVVTEVPPSNAQLDIAGVRGAVGDITLDADGNLTSTILDFTLLGLNDFQWIYIGGINAINAFANAAYAGSARIAKGGITAHKVVLDRREWTPAGADAGAGKLIDIYFSRWYRNVAMDDADYIKYPSYVFEVTFPFDAASQYWYPRGCLIDEWTWNLPLTSKATISAKFVGTKTANPSVARTTGPSTAIAPSAKAGISTAQDLPRLRVSNVDETGLTTSFQSLKIMHKNNVSPVKELGQLGARMMNVGKHQVEVDAEYIFTDAQVITAVSDNRDLTMDTLMRNGDFGALLDVQAMTLDTSDVKMEKNKSVGLGAKSTGHQDDITGSTCSLSVFAYLPNPTP